MLVTPGVCVCALVYVVYVVYVCLRACQTAGADRHFFDMHKVCIRGMGWDGMGGEGPARFGSDLDQPVMYLNHL
jgi:hypothetical protein